MVTRKVILMEIDLVIQKDFRMATHLQMDLMMDFRTEILTETLKAIRKQTDLS